MYFSVVPQVSEQFYLFTQIYRLFSSFLVVILVYFSFDLCLSVCLSVCLAGCVCLCLSLSFNYVVLIQGASMPKVSWTRSTVSF